MYRLWVKRTRWYYNLVQFTFPKFCHSSHLMVFHWNNYFFLGFFSLLSSHIRVLCPASCVVKLMFIAWTIIHLVSVVHLTVITFQNTVLKVFWLIRQKRSFPCLSVWNTAANTSWAAEIQVYYSVSPQKTAKALQCMSTEIHCVSTEKSCKKWLC